jgi:pilus assembly protein CpaB
VHAQKLEVPKGWNLVPVVVAAMDVSAGAVVAIQLLGQRAIPEQCVTSSVAKPDSASSVVNRKVLVPLEAGDPLRWSQLETTRAAEWLSTRAPKKAWAVTLETKGAASAMRRA